MIGTQGTEAGEVSASPRFAGESVTLGDRALVVPPLSLRGIRESAADFKTLAAMNGVVEPEQADAAVRVIHRALARNYPQLTVDEVADVVDLGNLGALLKVVTGQSGLTTSESQSAAAEGNG